VPFAFKRFNGSSHSSRLSYSLIIAVFVAFREFGALDAIRPIFWGKDLLVGDGKTAFAEELHLVGEEKDLVYLVGPGLLETASTSARPTPLPRATSATQSERISARFSQQIAGPLCP
jgi:hypothetical protein